MKSRIKVAACQLATRRGEVEENVTAALEVAERAAAEGAEYILFHENMVHEYVLNAAELAEPIPGPVTDRFSKFCADHKVGIGFGLTLRHEPKPYNGAVFIDSKGNIVATYAKRRLVTRGSYEVYMAKLEEQPIDVTGHEGLLENEVFDVGVEDCIFDWDGVRAGAMICADTGGAQIWAALREAGVQVAFVPFNNPGLRLYHPRIWDQVREFGGYFVGCDRSGFYPMDLPGRGQSLILDPQGNTLAQLDDEVNAFCTADLDLDQVQRGDGA